MTGTDRSIDAGSDSGGQSEDEAATFCRASRVPFRKLDEQTVIVDPRNRQVHVVNDTGAAIWQLLERRRTVHDLVAALMSDEAGSTSGFDGDAAAIARDVEAFVADLAAKGLVIREPPPRDARERPVAGEPAR